jgi:hypothetical protein
VGSLFSKVISFTVTVGASANGNTQNNEVNMWQHKSKYGVLIRKLDGGQNGVLTLPSIPVEDRYQDSGEYVCTAGNDINSWCICKWKYTK